MIVKSDGGNVLFLILVAVVLFAALSYAVTQSSRGGGNAESEVSLIKTAQITQYGNQIKFAVDRLMLVNGCAESELSFEHADLNAGYVNAGAPTDNSCHVFHTDGGGVTYLEPPSDWLGVTPSSLGYNVYYDQWYGDWFITGSDVSDIGTGADDLILVLPFVSRALCLQINNSSGIDNPSGEPPQDVAVAFDINPFDGDLTTDKVLSGTDGFYEGCIEGGATSGLMLNNMYAYYQVLIAH